ncbi:MAG: ribosomal-processing cysteine protease Prp, partial [Oscillospiraceae bacterium]|nr:ribosomal-processing cysteine protease Prp [Oscillospiraceae bacterium]
MICVKMDGSRLTVRGHAGYGKPGEDVVCAAASAL